MILTPQELFQLTKRRKYSAQARALRTLGIEHRVRADGSIVVLRTHVDALLGGGTANHQVETAPQPNWNAM